MNCEIKIKLNSGKEIVLSLTEYKELKKELGNEKEVRYVPYDPIIPYRLMPILYNGEITCGDTCHFCNVDTTTGHVGVESFSNTSNNLM